MQKSVKTAAAGVGFGFISCACAHVRFVIVIKVQEKAFFICQQIVNTVNDMVLKTKLIMKIIRLIYIAYICT